MNSLWRDMYIYMYMYRYTYSCIKKKKNICDKLYFHIWSDYLKTFLKQNNEKHFSLHHHYCSLWGKQYILNLKFTLEIVLVLKGISEVNSKEILSFIFYSDTC